jgi:HemK-like putative methylase
MDNAAFLLRDKYNGIACPEYANDLKLLEAGVPLAYLIGWVPFFGTRIYLDSQPLIPRPETEWWTEKITHEIPIDTPLQILDVFAGSGCVGIALLKHFHQSRCTFAEIDTRHLATITKNVTWNAIGIERVAVLQSDIFSNITGTFDLIVANPPYIPQEHQTTALPELSHEPPSALYAGAGGLELIHTFLKEAPRYLNPSGTIYMEFNEGQEHDILDQCKVLPLSAKVHHDQYGRMRLLVAQYMR